MFAPICEVTAGEHAHLRTTAAEKTGKRNHFVDDCQIGVEVDVFLDEFGQLAVSTG